MGKCSMSATAISGSFPPATKRCTRHVKYDPFSKTAHVYGPMPAEPKLLDTLSLPDPDKAAASVLGSSFHVLDAAPDTAPELVLEGPTLPIILKECLVHSDN